MVKNLLLVFFFFFLLAGVVQAQSETYESNMRPESPALAKKTLTVTNHIELYPNPVAEHLNISIENSTFDKVEFEVYNIIGNSLNIKVEETGANSYRINLKELNAGYYLLVIKDPVKRLNKSVKFQKM